MTVTIRTRLDNTQDLPECNLNKRHRQKLIASCEASAFSGHWITSNTQGKFLKIEHVPYLRKCSSPFIYSLLRMDTFKTIVAFKWRTLLFGSLLFLVERNRKKVIGVGMRDLTSPLPPNCTCESLPTSRDSPVSVLLHYGGRWLHLEEFSG